MISIHENLQRLNSLLS